MKQHPKISSSILSANFAILGQEVADVTQAGADSIHIDVMDGHFVPNLTFGPQIIKAIRPYSSLPFDVHLMINNVDSYLEDFVAAGADRLIVHPEAEPHIHRVLQKIKKLGKKAGLALNPATSPQVIEYLLDEIDYLLIMSVNPGFGGQSFIYQQLEKIKVICSMVGERPIEIAVDGGVTLENAQKISEAGASTLIAGTAIFNNLGYETNIKRLRGEIA
ncbi:MAG: ribulose-phosphate 3-epimerase [Candidatus Paracaedimonas acanthamoebae]|uniref:Ribulose-phosphate 3-epimerase n=1 Tax=Candidatus Paracaedimonas acanthamoebae TaxID=244581 RepID=A0A8J7TT32_9PROT|nr:ribulose-phosphate 3-epimerase [Candidatus Paracaedimonas acanthamoebae]